MNYKLLTIVSNQLTFGCAKAVDADLAPATILVYDSPRQIILRRPPQRGDRFLCKRYHSSVYLPIQRVHYEHLLLWKSVLPSDILLHYFPLVEPI